MQTRNMAEPETLHRPIRSFVLREGRLTPGQQRAFETLWSRFGAELGDGPLDLPGLFGNDHPVRLEIGFGNGESLAEMAAAAPQTNFLGVEVHRPGVGHLLMEIEKRGLHNLRVMRHDAVQVLRQGIPAGALEGVFLLFPDPWPKKRHHKRRILQTAFVQEVARTLKPGGFFHAATDWEDYAQHMMQVLSAASDRFVNQAGPARYTPRPEYRPRTKFEARGERLGHGVWDLVFVRK